MTFLTRVSKHVFSKRSAKMIDGTGKTQSLQNTHHDTTKSFCYKTYHKQRLPSAGDNDHRSKCFCSNTVLHVSFM